VRDRRELTPKAVGNGVALLLAELARRERRHLRSAPSPPPNKVNQLLSRGHHGAATARKGGPKGQGGAGGQKVFAAGARKGRIPSEKQMEGLAPGRDKAMDPLRVHRNALDQAELSPRGHRRPQHPARYPPEGRYFVAGLAFSLRWKEFFTVPFWGLPTGVATAGADAFVIATSV
jgi:hypothetical protein